MKDLEAQIRTLRNEPMLLESSITQEITAIHKASDKILNQITKAQKEIASENETSVEHLKSIMSALQNLMDEQMKNFQTENKKMLETIKPTLEKIEQSHNSKLNSMDQNFNSMVSHIRHTSNMNNLRNHLINIGGSSILTTILVLILHFIGVI
ncbi:hypothetical protein B6N84_12860 [Staphylococcus lugdunensis]|nr:hypothetical protein B6N84_12860 [Staphylococcus lugdunensis]